MISPTGPAQDTSLSHPVNYDYWLSKIARQLREQDAVIVSHYYTDPDIQRLAEDTGGVVADSLDMAAYGVKHPAKTLLIAGVRFMGETAKILSPEKRVLMPDLNATCSLDLGCTPDQFAHFRAQHPERTVVVYANTSAAIKAQTDWIVTSSIAVDLVEYLDSRGEKILWAPDRHLGDYVQRKTGADMVMWNGSCIVHEEFKGAELKKLRSVYPDAMVLAHPESGCAVLQQADVVGSTSKLIEAVATGGAGSYIVATERGIFYKMRQQAPEGVELLEAPTAGEGATCRSCARCPWMAMNTLEAISNQLQNKTEEIEVPEDIQVPARKALERMLNFKKSL